VIDIDIPLGLVAAVGATTCFELSYVLQALEARTTERRLALRASLLATLARRRRWVVGIAIGVAGWGLQIVALSLAPLTLVQPVLASGLLLLMYLGVRMLGERIGRRELAGAAAIVTGIAALALSAPSRATSVSSSTGLAIALAALGLAAVGPYVLRSRGGAGGLPLMVSAGAADATAGVAAKLISDELSRGRMLAALAWAAVAGATVLLGLLSESTALQRLPATRVAPVVLVLQVTVPVLLAPAVFGEPWTHTPLGGGLIAAALALVAAGTVALAGSTVVGDMMSADARKDDRGG
jgi:drug/metabolite transporter (DMT)-like permease